MSFCQAEIVPTKIRGRAIALSTVAVWLGDTITNYFFRWAREHWGPRPFVSSCLPPC
jgi:hypothetical protein